MPRGAVGPPGFASVSRRGAPGSDPVGITAPPPTLRWHDGPCPLTLGVRDAPHRVWVLSPRGLGSLSSTPGSKALPTPQGCRSGPRQRPPLPSALSQDLLLSPSGVHMAGLPGTGAAPRPRRGKARGLPRAPRLQGPHPSRAAPVCRCHLQHRAASRGASDAQGPAVPGQTTLPLFPASLRTPVLPHHPSRRQLPAVKSGPPRLPPGSRRASHTTAGLGGAPLCQSPGGLPRKSKLLPDSFEEGRSSQSPESRPQRKEVTRGKKTFL